MLWTSWADSLRKKTPELLKKHRETRVRAVVVFRALKLESRFQSVHVWGPIFGRCAAIVGCKKLIP